MNNGSYGAFQRGGSSLSGVTQSVKAAEAQLLSQATSTAMIAASSILMSGGSEEVALKTAKAAAASVLNPTASDTDTISGRSTTFLRRRKTKRQAEVVASMALMTASSNMRNGLGSDWSTGESNLGSHMNPYVRNITTRSMNTQDEPSVLSGSTRPPKPPTPRSEGHKSVHSRSMDPNMFVVAEQRISPTEGMLCTPPPLLSPRVGSSPNHTSPAVAAILGRSPKTSALPKAQSICSPKLDKLPGTPTTKAVSSNNAAKGTKARTPDVESMPLEGPQYSITSADGNDSEAVTTMDSRDQTLDGDYDDETTLDATWNKNRDKKSLLKEFDPIFNIFTSAFNLLTCGPLSSFGQAESGSRSQRNSRQITQDYGDETVASGGEETMDDRDDTGTGFRSMDSYDQSNMNDIAVGESLSGDSSADSSSLLRELQSSSSSEGEIQVRSSIRDTMEKIVSKSKKGLKDENRKDKKWLSYELRQDDGPEIATSNVKRKGKWAPNTPTKNGKKPFFFKRRSMKKQQRKEGF